MWRQKRRATFGKSRKLIALVLIAIVALVAAIALIETRPDQSTAAFEYSLSVNSAELNDDELATALDMAQAAGANSTSYGAVWWYMNRDRPPRSYDWSYLDRLVSGAEARRMKVKLQLHGTPDWVHLDLQDTVPDPMDRSWHPPRSSSELEHWGDFVHDVVSRYKGRVDSYEIWNEPNIDTFWKPAPDPAEYVALLRTSYLSAKSAYPDAVVVFGGLSRNDIGYLNTYYSEAKKYSDAANDQFFFDVLDVHPYSSIPSPIGGLEEPTSPDNYTPIAISDGYYGEVDKNFLGIQKMKATMDKQGDLGKYIFIGEYGFSTADTWMKAVPDNRRALYLKRAYTLARSLPYIKGMSWYSYHPTSSDPPEWTIVDSDWNPSLTYQALKQIATEGRPAIEVFVSPLSGALSGVREVRPTLFGTDPPEVSMWELYVDGTLTGTYESAPFNWDTSSVGEGEHELMVVAYAEDGSVWPSSPTPIEVNVASATEPDHRLEARYGTIQPGRLVMSV